MASIMIRCPRTGFDVSTGIEMDWAAFNRLREVHAEINCPACGGTHVWTRAEAWLTHGARDRDPKNRDPKNPDPKNPDLKSRGSAPEARPAGAVRLRTV